jgi:hypothetical protein
MDWQPYCNFSVSFAQLLMRQPCPGNGQYREELRRTKAAIQAYIQAHSFPAERMLLRLDGQYGTRAVIRAAMRITIRSIS